MKKKLNVPLYDFESFQKVSDLIYYDGPFLSHFISPAGDDYLFYWIDSDETYNKWIVFRTNSHLLNGYINQKITLRYLLQSADSKFAYLLLIDNELNYKNGEPFLISELEDEYLPSDSSYYTFEKRDYSPIISLSKKEKTGFLELKLSGPRVNYGEIPYNLFNSANEIFREVLNKVSKSYVTKNISRNEHEKSKRNIHQRTEFNVYSTAYPSSFKVIMKPNTEYLTVEDGWSEEFTDSVIKEVVKLLNSGYGPNFEELNYFIENYANGDELIVKYTEFADFIQREGLNIAVAWYNDKTKELQQNHILYEDAPRILKMIEEFREQDPLDFDVIGKFYGVNVDTGHFSFKTLSEDPQKFTGPTEKNLIDSLKDISFNKTYNIKLRRERKKIKDEHKLVSFNELGKKAPLKEKLNKNLDSY